jgi:phosphoenolpyruvate carboxykinase (GTP)
MTYQVKNEKLNNWVREVADLCQPDTIYWCDGSKEEYDRLMAQMVAEGKATPLMKRPNCFLFRSAPSDVARVESRTFIATQKKDQVGPTNNWVHIDHEGPVSGLHEGSHDVCDPLLHGAHRVACGEDQH